MRDKVPQVYVITNKINQKIYIGKTNDLITRWYGHISDVADINNKRYLYCAMRKYGIDNFIIEPIAYYTTDEEALQAEIYWIAELRKFCKLYNLTDGGDGATGYKQTEAAKKKLSEIHLGEKNHRYGKPMSDKNKSAISKANKGVLKSKEHKENLSKAAKGRTNFKGKTHSEETKRKMSETKSGDKSYNFGSHLSDEAKKNLSDKWKGKSWILIDGKRKWIDK